MKLCRQINELQQEHEQQWAQHALMDETMPLQVKDPSQKLNRTNMVSSVVDRMQRIQQHAWH